MSQTGSHLQRTCFPWLLSPFLIFANYSNPPKAVSCSPHPRAPSIQAQRKSPVLKRTQPISPIMDRGWGEVMPHKSQAISAMTDIFLISSFAVGLFIYWAVVSIRFQDCRSIHVSL